MTRVHERRRHSRRLLTYPATIRDRAGRVVFRGRTSDVSPCGIRIIGPAKGTVRAGIPVWVELGVPNKRRSGPRTRIVKLEGEVRRAIVIGDWRGVIVVLSSDFSPAMLAPV